MTIQFESRKLIPYLLTIVLCLIAAHLLGLVSTYVFGHNSVWGLVKLFSLTREANVPTFFSAVLLLFCSALLALIGIRKKRSNDPFYRHWKGLAAIFLFMSIDEAVQIHELLIDPIHTALNTSGILLFAWVIPYSIAAAIVLVLFLPFLWCLPPVMRSRTLLAAFVYVGGALGFELLDGYYFDFVGRQDVIYGLITMVEESLEMFGLVIFVHALTSYLESGFAELPESSRAERFTRPGHIVACPGQSGAGLSDRAHQPAGVGVSQNHR
jgi:hypothetical protein